MVPTSPNLILNRYEITLHLKYLFRMGCSPNFNAPIFGLMI